ncbi:MAG: hypothetical protein OER90_06605 [Gemmatimonadota bacterium]|nr:hypothetical protein [Gemmatimonadota bacterium]
MPAPAAAKSNPWRFVWRAEAQSAFDDNVFLLSPSKKAELATPSVDDVASGRFADMADARDVVTLFEAGLGFAGPGITGRTLEILPEVAYEWYAQNSARSHAVIGLRVEQGLPHGSRLRLRGRLTPSYFPKAYLADAVDANADGTISGAERVYQPATYQESRIALDYRFRLANATRRHPFGAAVQLSGAYERRVYDTPFRVRDRSGPEAGLALLLDLTRSIALDVEYGFASYSATPAAQVLVLDEDDAGRDLNGNGTLTDPNVRVVQQVDVSRIENRLGAALTVALAKRTHLTVQYERRWRRYGSEEPFDIAYGGRRDSRHQVGIELETRLAGDLALVLGGDLTDQGLNRSSDLGGIGDIDDYSRHRAFLGLSYQP